MLARHILPLILIGYTLGDDTSLCGDWVAFKDEKCFKVLEGLSNESVAEELCRKKGHGVFLATIGTDGEQEIVINYLKSIEIENNVWIGLKKTDTSFKWLDGTDVKYTNWVNDRPLRNLIKLNCAEISVDQEHFGKWNDNNCGKKNAVLCQKVQPWSNNRLKDIILETQKNFREELQVLKSYIIPGQKSELDNLIKKIIPSQQKVIDSQNTEINDLKSELNILKSKAIPDQQKLLDSHKTELDNLKLQTIPEQQKILDSQKSEINALKSNPVPIGFIYVQLSGQSYPMTLWPNTEWENISPKYSGLFFRAEGGQSSPFGLTQEQQTQSIEFITDQCDGSTDYWKSWTKVTQSVAEKFSWTGGNAYSGYSIGIKLRHNTEEIRPRNQAIRIWQRIK